VRFIARPGLLPWVGRTDVVSLMHQKAAIHLTQEPAMSLAEFRVEQGRQIDTREELLLALTIAAELEHSLLVQYLFSSYSMRKRPGNGLDVSQVELVRDWEAAILTVARDEMVHFATVTKIAVAVGGTPHLNRATFPQPEGAVFPFELRLHRFSVEEIARFVRFETPADAPAAEAFRLAPQVPEFEYLGELYGQIKGAIIRLAERHGEDWLLVGPPELREEEDWGLRHVVRAIRSSAEAVAAVQEIIDEGEGGEHDVENSHWQRFIQIESTLGEELRKDPGFQPAHPVVANPVTRPHPGGTLLEGLAREVAELFNHLYTTILMLLGQFYAPVGETAAQRDALQATARRSMSAILRPIAEILAEIPVAQGCAGAPFETYAPIVLASSTAARWAVLVERLQRARDEAERLAESGIQRLPFIAENVGLMQEAIERIAAGQEVGVARPRV
jgi:Ferritin-like